MYSSSYGRMVNCPRTIAFVLNSVAIWLVIVLACSIISIAPPIMAQPNRTVPPRIGNHQAEFVSRFPGSLKELLSKNSSFYLEHESLGIVSFRIRKLNPHSRTTIIESSLEAEAKERSLLLGDAIIELRRGLTRTQLNARTVRASISASIDSDASNKNDYLRIRFTKHRGAGRVYEITIDKHLKARVRQVSLRALSSRGCGFGMHKIEQPKTLAATTSDEALTQSVALPLTSKAEATKIFTVTTDCDLECYTKLGQSQANDRILEFFNSVSTLYGSSFGYNFNVVEQKARNTSAPYPALTTNSDALLALFHIRAASLKTADFKHLITGKNMEDNVIGLSFVAVACVNPTFSLGYSQHINTLLTPIIIAHELGHNFSASHDPKEQGIMSTELASPFPTAFSNFSKNQIQTHVANLGNRACFDTAPVSSSSSSNSSSVSSGSSSSRGTSSESSSSERSGSGDDPSSGNVFKARLSTRLSSSRFRAAITQERGACTIAFQVAKSEAALSSQPTLLFNGSISASEQINFVASEMPKVYRAGGKKALVWFNVASNCNEGSAISDPITLNVATSKKAKGRKIALKNTKAWIDRLKNSLKRN